MIVIKHRSTLNERFIGLDESKIWVTPLGVVCDVKGVNKIIRLVLEDLSENHPGIEESLRHSNIILTPMADVMTMATDGLDIFINPRWVELMMEQLGDDDGGNAIEYAIIHEALHNIFNHPYQENRERAKYPDHDRANRAQDYLINYFIENYLIEGINGTPFKGLSSKMGILYNDSFGERSLSWQEIYKEIPSRKRFNQKKKLPDDVLKAFIEGFNEVADELRNKNLIE